MPRPTSYQHLSFVVGRHRRQGVVVFTRWNCFIGCAGLEAVQLCSHRLPSFSRTRWPVLLAFPDIKSATTPRPARTMVVFQDARCSSRNLSVLRYVQESAQLQRIFCPMPGGNEAARLKYPYQTSRAPCLGAHRKRDPYCTPYVEGLHQNPWKRDVGPIPRVTACMTSGYPVIAWLEPRAAFLKRAQWSRSG